MKTIIQTALISTSFMLAASAYAVPNVFTSGQPARASEVNANFADVEAQIANNAADIAANAANITSNTAGINTNASAIANNAAAIAAIPTVSTYDYRNFATDANIISKTFATTGLCGDSEVRTIARTPNGPDTNVVVTRRRLNGATTCQLNDFSYVSTASEHRLVQGKNYNAADDSLVETKTPADPIVVFSSSMRDGATFASATTVTSTFADGVTPVVQTVYVDSNAAVGLENVSVPAGNFTGCLKISSTRLSNTFGAYKRISWRCPGVGEVKRIQMRTDNAGGFTWVLTNIVTATP